MQGNRELRFACIGGVVEGLAGTGAFAGMENDSMLDAVREAGEASLAIDVGVNLQVQLADAPCAVGDVNTDHRVVDGSSGLIGDGKVRRARADTGDEARLLTFGRFQSDKPRGFVRVAP